MKHTILLLLVAVPVLGSSGLRAATDNQLIDDYWRHDGTKGSGAQPSGPAQPASSTAASSKNQLIDDYWRHDGSKRSGAQHSGPPQPASSTAASSENQLIDDYWRHDGTKRSGAQPSKPPQPSETAQPSKPALASNPPQPSETARPAALTAAGASAAAQPGQLIPAVVGLPPAPNSLQPYRIGPNDILKIQVFQVDELSSEERVSETGQIVMPLIGPVKVTGLTAHEAGNQIAAILRKDYMQNPQVDVYVKDAVSQQITVMGSVVKPGVFPISGQTTLLQAVALAQGFAPLAKQNEVIVFRKDGSGNPIAYVVDVSAVQKGELTDPLLVGNDRVVVPESGTRVFFKGVTDTLRGFVSFGRTVY